MAAARAASGRLGAEFKALSTISHAAPDLDDLLERQVTSRR
jgi:hypothetical protein